MDNQVAVEAKREQLIGDKSSVAGRTGPDVETAAIGSKGQAAVIELQQKV